MTTPDTAASNTTALNAVVSELSTQLAAALTDKFTAQAAAAQVQADLAALRAQNEKDRAANTEATADRIRAHDHLATELDEVRATLAKTRTRLQQVREERDALHAEKVQRGPSTETQDIIAALAAFTTAASSSPSPCTLVTSPFDTVGVCAPDRIGDDGKAVWRAPMQVRRVGANRFRINESDALSRDEMARLIRILVSALLYTPGT